MSNNTILVVEDDDDLRDGITEALSAEGFQVLTADNGLAALNVLVSRKGNNLPACIVLDLMMPMMHGNTFIEILQRERPQDLAKIPLIIATAAGRSALPNTLPASAQILKKPMRLDDLIEAVAKYARAAPNKPN